MSEEKASLSHSASGHTDPTEWGKDEDDPVQFYTVEPAHNHLAWFPAYLCILSPRNTGNAVYGAVSHEDNSVLVNLREYCEENGLDVNIAYHILRVEHMRTSHAGTIALEDFKRIWKAHQPPQGFVSIYKFLQLCNVTDGCFNTLMREGIKPPEHVSWLDTELYAIRDAERIRYEHNARGARKALEKKLAHSTLSKRNKLKGPKSLRRNI